MHTAVLIRSNTWACVVGLLVGSVCQAAPLANNDERAAVPAPGHIQALKPFTVADSIKSTHFVQPEEYTNGSPPVSPNGKSFLVVTERGLLESNLREFTLLVYELDHLSAEPLRLASFRTSSNRPGIDEARWIDNNTISFIGEDPNELPQVYFADCRRHKIRQLTKAPGGVEAYDVTPDLKTVAYYSYWRGDNAENNIKEGHGFAVTDEGLSDLVNGHWKAPDSCFEMFLLNPASGKTRRVNASPFIYSQTRLAIWLSPDGRYAVTEQAPFSVPTKWSMYDDRNIQGRAQRENGRVHRIRVPSFFQYMLVDTQTAEIRPLLDAPVRGEPLVVWLPDSHSVVVAGTLLPLDTTDQDELARREKNLAAAEVTVPDLSFRRITDISTMDYWVRLRPGRSPDTFFVDATQGRPGGSWIAQPAREYRRAGDHWIQDGSFTQNNPESQIKISEAINRWPKLVKVDPVMHNETVILDPNPQFKSLRFGREEILRWTGNLGQPLVGGLLYPPDYIPGKKYPLVIQTYVLKEDGFLLDGPMTTAYAAQALVNHNVFVLQLSQSPLYQKSFGTAELGRTEMSQIDSAVDYLDSLGLIDTEHVGLIGFSMKGYQVTYTITHSKHHYAAATSAEGNDWGYWTYVGAANFPLAQAQIEAPFGGPPWEGNWKSWMEESISFNYDKIHTPLRLEADIGDLGAVLNEWEAFVALKRLRKPVELIYASHGWHPVVRPWDRMMSQQGNVDWLMFWLKGEEDDDPAKAQQYARWHELRKLQDNENVAARSGGH